MVDGITGQFFDGQNVDALCSAVVAFTTQSFDTNGIRRRAQDHGVPRFIERIRSRCVVALGERKAQLPNGPSLYGPAGSDAMQLRGLEQSR